MRKTVRIILLFSTICLFLIGYIYTHFNIMFTATMMLLVNNIFYSLESIRRRFVFLFFNISFFTFLMGQDLFEMINGQTWWASFPSSIMEHTLLVLFISLLSLYIGSVIMEKLNKKNKSNDYKPKKSIAGIRKTSKILFYLTFTVAFIVLLERVLFVQNYGYVALYLDYVSQIPYIIKKIAITNSTFLYIYLATMPLKREARPVVLLQLVYLGVSVLSGVRGTLVVGLMVLIIYFIFRDAYLSDYDEKWLGKAEKYVLIIGLPFFLAFLSAYGVIRVGGNIGSFSLINEMINFFKSQGGSVQVISFSKIYENYLPSTNINYTFSPIINYFTIGSIASIFTGLTPLVDKVDIALYGNNLGATITYIVNPQYYLAGGGMGTQYIAELYADFGYAGVIVFNLLMGALLSLLFKSNKWWLLAISLLMCNAIMDMPRNFALTWLGVWVAFPTWIPIIVTYLGASFINKRANRKEGIKKELSMKGEI